MGVVYIFNSFQNIIKTLIDLNYRASFSYVEVDRVMKIQVIHSFTPHILHLQNKDSLTLKFYRSAIISVDMMKRKKMDSIKCIFIIGWGIASYM